MDGLLAPFLIDSYTLQRRVLASDLPAQVLPSVQRLGVLGIAVLPGPQQRLLSIGTPMLAPPDYAIQEIGVHPATEEARLFRALGRLRPSSSREVTSRGCGGSKPTSSSSSPTATTCSRPMRRSRPT